MVYRRNVIFQAPTFNTSDSKEYFINPDCYGDDVANWLIESLRSRGMEVSEQPEQEDFGWYFSYKVGSEPYDFVIGYRPAETEAVHGDWVCCVEKKVGFLASVLGGRKKVFDSTALEIVHSVLSESPQITNIRWFSDEEMRTEEEGSSSPTD